jgi:hypothetical protein
MRGRVVSDIQARAEGNLIHGEKIELSVYANQHDFVSDMQTPSRYRSCRFQTFVYYSA